MLFVLWNFRVVSPCHDQLYIFRLVGMLLEEYAEGIQGQVDVLLPFVSVQREEVLPIDFWLHFFYTFGLNDVFVKLGKIQCRVQNFDLDIEFF